MSAVVTARDRAMVRLATVVGIPLYTVFGGVGLWGATRFWDHFVCNDVLAPSVLGGPTSAIGATSAIAVVVGIAGVASLSRRVLVRAVGEPAHGILLGAAVGAATALGPSLLIVLACQHPVAGAVATLIGLIVPAALTGGLGVALLRPVARSRTLTGVFIAAKWMAVVTVGLWAVLSFAPLDRWMLLACTAG